VGGIRNVAENAHNLVAAKRMISPTGYGKERRKLGRTLI